MENLLLFDYAVSIVLLILVKIKTDMKIIRVLMLSFIPILVASLIFVIIGMFFYSRVHDALLLLVVFLGTGLVFCFPVVVAWAIFVKFLQKKNFSLLTVASVGAIFGTSLLYIFTDIDKEGFASYAVIPISYFVSVLVDNKYLKDKVES